MLTFYTFIFKFGAVKYMDVYMLGVERLIFKVDFYVMKVKSKSTSHWWRH